MGDNESHDKNIKWRNYLTASVPIDNIQSETLNPQQGPILLVREYTNAAFRCKPRVGLKVFQRTSHQNAARRRQGN